LVVNSNENKKLEGAYNFALGKATQSGRDWILLLDQDTVIPENYFNELEQLFSEHIQPDLAAIVPKLVSNNKIISPVRVSSLMRFESEINIIGYTKKRINALNSLSLFNVQFINSIGGFSKDYPFDMHDHWCYNQIYKHQKSVFIMNVIGEHNSSFVDFENNVSDSRYREFLDIQRKFTRNELSCYVYLFYKIKLLLRGTMQLIKYKNKKFALITLSSIFKK
jgi:GT2 family glycosyltransferase